MAAGESIALFAVHLTGEMKTVQRDTLCDGNTSRNNLKDKIVLPVQMVILNKYKYGCLTEHPRQGELSHSETQVSEPS